ncbi:MAG: type I secretion system permease/ATPase, partial [Comamonadaceae bacterium CG_4_9_14_3_um_filter_60_33]
MPNSDVSGVANAPQTAADELLACLQIIARTHGEAATRDALMAGLPAEHARLTPSLFARAALRAHLSSQLVTTPLAKLNDALLPAVALLQDDRACVVLGFNAERDQFQVIYPELVESTVTVPLSALEADYIGTTIYARPTQRYDARTPQVRAGRHGHWFWGVIAESTPLYRDVLLAALLANTFALGMPLFIMNV